MGKHLCTLTKGSLLILIIMTTVMYFASLGSYQLMPKGHRTDKYADELLLDDTTTLENVDNTDFTLESLIKKDSLDQLDVETNSREYHNETLAQGDRHAVDSSQVKCPKIKVMRYLKSGELPLTTLASYPGSGNTWIRALISGITGVNTGDIYKDWAFKKTPGFANINDDTVVVIKTHHPTFSKSGPDPRAPKGRYWERAVVVMRHPLDAILSFFNYKSQQSHTKVLRQSAFIHPNGTLTSKWTIWVHSQLRNWGRFMEYWINQYEGPKYLLVYEVLKEHPQQELTALNSWIGLKLNSRRLFCTLQSELQMKFQRHSDVDKRRLYDSSMLDEVEVVLRTTVQMISDKYMHPIPLHIPDSYLTLEYWRNKSNASP